MVKKFIQHAREGSGETGAGDESTQAYARDREPDSKSSHLAAALSHMDHAHKKHSASNKTIRKSMYHGE